VTTELLFLLDQLAQATLDSDNHLASSQTGMPIARRRQRQRLLVVMDGDSCSLSGGT
jgi:hypothetical protein